MRKLAISQPSLDILTTNWKDLLFIRLLVILVKLFKLIEYKREFLGNIIWMNDNAEKVNLFTNTVDTYPDEFKVINY